MKIELKKENFWPVIRMFNLAIGTVEIYLCQWFFKAHLFCSGIEQCEVWNPHHVWTMRGVEPASCLGNFETISYIYSLFPLELGHLPEEWSLWLDLVRIQNIQYKFWVIRYVKYLPLVFLHVGYFPIIFLMRINYISQPYCKCL